MHEITQYVEEFVERDIPGSGRFSMARLLSLLWKAERW